ncbi:hypothetical protein DPEC_G00030310 [Dallia pectoralis]|uniref:Uncharacterized protein n=1 Tax=Dallia pectoralis TaxID=75939 RepID=A0ACC2HC86_DALPE|nr:hypothetical protein DPEC_G00030310 [Dallia pectoralis]
MLSLPASRVKELLFGEVTSGGLRDSAAWSFSRSSTVLMVRTRSMSMSSTMSSLSRSLFSTFFSFTFCSIIISLSWLSSFQTGSDWVVSGASSGASSSLSP